MRKSKNTKTKTFFISIIFVSTVILVFIYLFSGGNTDVAEVSVEKEEVSTEVAIVEVEKEKPVIRIDTPENVYAVYMTACAAGTKRFRDRIYELYDETRINSVVIDIKDYSGTVHFITDNDGIRTYKDDSCILKNFKDIVREFNERGIYTIARLTAFQDSYWASRNLDHAVQKADRTLWKDYKGISFVDPSSKLFWNYLRDISVAAYDEIGFDEINFDYIRFPSDGNLADTYFPFSEERILGDVRFGKADIMEEFFQFLNEEMRVKRSIPISADIFGQAAVNYDDLNIGHVLEKAAPYFDTISLMLYPSHFINGFNNIADPNKQPYDIVSYSIKTAIDRMELQGYAKTNLRPWIQDFDWPVEYDLEKVKDQIRAVDEVAIGGWMMWDPSVTYTKEAY